MIQWQFTDAWVKIPHRINFNSTHILLNMVFLTKTYQRPTHSNKCLHANNSCNLLNCECYIQHSLCTLTANVTSVCFINVPGCRSHTFTFMSAVLIHNNCTSYHTNTVYIFLVISWTVCDCVEMNTVSYIFTLTYT